MEILELSIEGFRNYESLLLNLGPGLNIVLGDNAQGKTNLLEAIFALATTRSFRTSKEVEMIGWRHDMARIRADVGGRLSCRKAEVVFSRSAAKVAKLASTKQRRLSDYIGQTTVVVFTPDDLQLAKGGPTYRRRFLDLLLSQADPVYCRVLTSYARILQQRNACLRACRQGDSGPTDLEPWTAELVSAGSVLCEKRMAALGSLGQRASDVLSDVTQGAEKLAVIYECTAGQDHGTDRHGLRAAMEAELRRRSREELLRATTVVGPHRDDFRIEVNGTDSRAYGSQGQQRCAVLAMKMAEVSYLRDSRDEYPILLLDDVMSELDQGRQARLLLSVAEETQAILTTTDLKAVGPRTPDSAVVFAVSKGLVKPLREA